MANKLCCGLDFPPGTDVKMSLNYSVANGFDFLSVPIVQPGLRDPSKSQYDLENIIFTRDLEVSQAYWKSFIIGRLSNDYNVDSEDETHRVFSENRLVHEMLHASYLGVSTVILKLDDLPKSNLARVLHDHMCSKNTNRLSVWVHVPMIDPQSTSKTKDRISRNAWDWWNDFKLMCNSDRNLGVALEVTASLPSEEELARWFGEPLKVILLPISIFVTNKKGFPVLPQSHNTFFKMCVSHNLKILLTGSFRHKSMKNYFKYLNFIYKVTPVADCTPFSKGYEDNLQIPLQPLMDNLDSATYEAFEKDPVKYTQYGRAIYEALMDRVPEAEKSTKVQVVMVVGAGRGPLVDAALKSAEKSGRKIRCYAVEKNPNALLTLLTRKAEEWGDKVEVVGSDMRVWDAPEKCDILVSELLGSFGDNELSPECLDGAQKFLRDDGISIPSRYTSYLCPTQSSKLFNEAKLSNLPNKPPLAAFEMPYVVHQLSAYTIAKPQPLFTFEHPNKDSVIDNRRYKILKFKVEQDSVLNGFTGYFHTTLYKDINLSIVPDTFSNGMFSWFPLFFPIKDPVKLRKDEELIAHFWRLGDKNYVWYEWSVSKPIIVPIHNANGRSYRIGLH